jgi:hypothetical protein
MKRVSSGLSLALAAALSVEAKAADWYTGVPTDAVQAAPTIAVDTVIDGTSRQSIAGAMIGTIAPFTPLNQTGLRARISGLGAGYVYHATPTAADPLINNVNGTMADGAVQGGYEVVTDQMTIAGYAGVEVMNTIISPNDPNNTVKGTRAGLKISGNLYMTPNDFTMVSAVASYSTTFNSYYGRLKLGLAVWDHVYVGPEVLGLGDNFFGQWRAGAHLSGLRIGTAQFGVSGGYMHDRVRGSGAYGIVESRLLF